MSVRDSIKAARVSGPASETTGVAFEFQFPANDPVFAGHFPNRPILPGVFQLEMARMAAEWALDCSFMIREVCKAKFLQPILPDQPVRLNLKMTDDNGLWQARAAFSVNGRPAGETLLRLWRNA